MRLSDRGQRASSSRFSQQREPAAAQHDAPPPTPAYQPPAAYQAPELQQFPPPGPNRSGRLTQDERRALRQQINDAGRDVYRPYQP